MKILSTPIEVLAWFENGTPHPIRFKLNNKEIKIEQVISVTEERLAGNKMLIFRYKRDRRSAEAIRTKFELTTCKDFL